MVALCLAAYILGPPLYWHLTEALAAVRHASSSSSSPSCPPCVCDCASQPLLSMPLGTSPPDLTLLLSIFTDLFRFPLSVGVGLSNSSYADCAKHNPEVSEDMEKNFAELLSEELKLREAEALESQQRADMALLEAKKLASSYQKEADKCNSGMETCEEAREKAEDTLLAQKRLTAMWELRARQRGWKEGSAKSHTASR
ncbi:hypothetical protein Sjap_003094 [Stephania japonica]|uniref:Uncharacterized protein n=1 Tax=Stephania japonica TaxID=461633 RepID=A0AAP0KPU8_9MAGN